MTIKEIIEKEGLIKKNEYPIYKYDKDMNRIYEEHEGSYWMQWKYNDKGQQTAYNDSDGLRETIEYNDNGDKIFYTNDRDGRMKREYDKQGNQTLFERFNGEYIKTEYDDNRNLLYYEDHKGVIKKNKYNSKNQLLRKEITEEGETKWQTFKYNKEGKIVYTEDNEGNFKKIERSHILEKIGDNWYYDKMPMVKK